MLYYIYCFLFPESVLYSWGDKFFMMADLYVFLNMTCNNFIGNFSKFRDILRQRDCITEPESEFEACEGSVLGLTSG